MSIACILNDHGEETPTTYVLRRALLAGVDGQAAVWLRQRRRWSEPFRSSWNGIPCYSLGTPRGWPLGRIVSALQMLWIFRHLRVELVHVHWSGVDHWGLSLLRRLAPRLPYALTFHAFNAARLTRMGLLDRRALERLMAGAARITAVSGALRSELEACCPVAVGSIRVIPNGVESAAGGGGLPAGVPEDFVLSVGTLCSYKGLDLLLFAFFDLWREGRLSLPLVLCGQDEPKGQAARLIERLKLQDRVILLPDCPHEVVAALMGRCRFFVSAAREEAFGLAILEAMAAGRAAAAPEVGGVPEYLEDGRNGLLFKAGDLEALKAAVERLAGDPALRERLGSEASRTAARYTWPGARQAYRRMREEILSGAR